MSNENKNLYCILLLCMMFNGSFSRNMFDIDSDECDKKIYKMTQTCGLQRNISKIELENGALSALRSYFRKDSNNFEQIHNVIEQTVGWQFCTMNPKGIFEKALENAEQKHRQHVYQDSEKEKDQIDHVSTVASKGNLLKNIAELTPSNSNLLNNNALFIVSYAFLKSIKAAYVDCLRSFSRLYYTSYRQKVIMVLITGKYSLLIMDNIRCIKLFRKRIQENTPYNLLIAGAKVIPRYEKRISGVRRRTFQYWYNYIQCP
ncbi:unnamed protein product [Mytilus edulis]|uniref:Uncharacterized protein n=1 Tax=Mytilus edulis TaxID=6550 RepID=A0A8S3QPX4_MYTED|nr:unnamed protein product [Mytilus edulis]